MNIEKCLDNYPSFISGVYMFISKSTKRRYIGSSVDVRARAREHLRKLKRKEHHSRRFQACYNKFGIDDFKWRVLERVEKEFLVEKEQYWINKIKKELNLLNSVFYPQKTTLGLKLTKKQKDAQKGRRSGEKNGMFGRKHTEKSKKRISQSRFLNGFEPYRTQEFREKISKIVKGKKNPNFGNHWSEEQKQKVRDKLKKRGGYKGKKNPNFGNHWSEEQKQKMSDRLKERVDYKAKKNHNFGRYKINKKLWPEIYEKIKRGIESPLTLSKKYNVHPTSINNYMERYEKEINL